MFSGNHFCTGFFIAHHKCSITTIFTFTEDLTLIHIQYMKLLFSTFLWSLFTKCSFFQMHTKKKKKTGKGGDRGPTHFYCRSGQLSVVKWPGFHNSTVIFALIRSLIIIVICLLRQLLLPFASFTDFVFHQNSLRFIQGCSDGTHITEGIKYKSNCHKNGNYNKLFGCQGKE